MILFSEMTKWFELGVQWLGIQIVWALQMWWRRQNGILIHIATDVPMALILRVQEIHHLLKYLLFHKARFDLNCPV